MGPNDKSPFELSPQPGLKPERILDFSVPVNPLGPSKRAERKASKVSRRLFDIRRLGMAI